MVLSGEYLVPTRYFPALGYEGGFIRSGDVISFLFLSFVLLPTDFYYFDGKNLIFFRHIVLGRSHLWVPYFLDISIQKHRVYSVIRKGGTYYWSGLYYQGFLGDTFLNSIFIVGPCSYMG